MKALILTCKTGEGHNATATAVIEAFAKHGVTCDRADTIDFLSRWLSRAIGHAHTRIYRHMPRAFDAGYRAVEEHPDVVGRKTLLLRILATGTKKLHRFIVDGGYDTVICAHVISALLVTELREKYPELKLHCSFIATDYTCSPTVGQCNMDAFFIPDASLAKDFITKGVPASRIVPSGIPIRDTFAAPVPPRQKQTSHILLMCGSMGCGPIEELTTRLSSALADRAIISVVCGTNGKLQRKLSQRFAKSSNVEILGFINHVPALMDSADLYLTKPGGISVSEAAAKGLPMVFVNAVAGCEEYNLRFFVENGMARTADSPEALCALCVALLSDAEALAAMRERAAHFAHPDAAERLYEHVTTAQQP